jgi:hypothetical protein
VRRARILARISVFGDLWEDSVISDEQLSVQERRLVAATHTGELIDLSVGDEEENDPAKGAGWDGTRTVRALELACPLLLRGCHIDEPVNLDEATAPAIRLPACHLPSLSADQIRTAGNLVLSDGFTASGEVRLAGAHIGGQLNLDGAQLTN